MTVIGGADFIAATGQRSSQNTRDLRFIIHHKMRFFSAMSVHWACLGGLLRDTMDIHGRHVSEKLVDGI